MSQYNANRKACTPSAQTQLYNRNAYQNYRGIEQSYVLPGPLSHAKIVHAVQNLATSGFPLSVLPTLLQPSCLESLNVLLCAIQDGLDSSQLTSIIQHLALSTPESFSHNQPASFPSGNIRRESSIRSYHSGMSGDTLYSSINDPDGLWKQYVHLAIPETQEEVISTPKSQNWHETESKQSSPRNVSYPGLMMNQMQDKLQSPFNDTLMTDLPGDGSLFTHMLQSNLSGQDSFLCVESKPPALVLQPEFVNPADVCKSQDQQSLTAADEEGQPSVCKSPSTSGVSVTRSRASHCLQGPRFVGWSPKEEKKPGYRSPCPLCGSDFIAQKEFISHTNAKHDQTIEFSCTHMAPTRKGLRRCPFKDCASSRFSKHHTEQHRECQMLPQCVQKIHKPRPKRVWGCWFCTWATNSLADWVSHHMQGHWGYPRNFMSYTTYMRSLLSQSAVRRSWQEEVKTLEEETGATWNITWYAGKDPTRDAIIHGLETGFWKDQDFHRTQEASQGIAAAALRATDHTRTKLGPLVDHEQSNVQRPSTSGSSPSRPRRQRSFPHLSLRRSRSTMRHRTTEAGGTFEDVPQLPSRTGDGHGQYSGTAFGAAHGNEVHMHLF